jgi:hypothetical protein
VTDNKRNTPSRLIWFLVVGGSSFLTSGVVAGIELWINRGFGASDLWPFLFWSVPFATGLSMISLSFVRWYCHLSDPIRFILGALVGMMAGLVWTYISALALGVWFKLLSLPALECWVSGGLVGMLIAASACKPLTTGRILVPAVLAIAVVTGVLAGSESLFALLSDDQSLELVFVTWKPSAEPLTIEKGYLGGLSADETARLKSIGLTGKIAVMASGTFGRGKHSRAVVVMQYEPGPLELAQPDGVEVIYVQYKDGWKVYPPDAPTLTRQIRFKPDERNPGASLYMVDLATGGTQGGTVYVWQ